MVLMFMYLYLYQYEPYGEDEDENQDVSELTVARVYTSQMELAGYHLTPTQKPLYNASDFKRLYFIIVLLINLASFFLID